MLIGSMNLDQRSQRINTEIGLIIGSADLAQQTALRFESMVKPENCYALSLKPAGAPDKSRLTWRTEESGGVVDYVREPGSSGWRRLQAKMLALVPMEREL